MLIKYLACVITQEFNLRLSIYNKVKLKHENIDYAVIQ